jgi:hypothetical protein
MESMHSEDQARRAAKRVGLQAWKVALAQKYD